MKKNEKAKRNGDYFGSPFLFFHFYQSRIWIGRLFHFVSISSFMSIKVFLSS